MKMYLNSNLNGTWCTEAIIYNERNVTASNAMELTSETPILRQASMKFSTLRRHLATVSLGTAGDGT